MPKISLEAIDARREEIIAACETLYKTMGFRDVTIKEIAKMCGCTKSSVQTSINAVRKLFYLSG